MPKMYFAAIVHIKICNAAYGTGATQMVTEEALAERKAALEGDPGTDNAVKISMPQEAPMHSAQQPSSIQQDSNINALESRVWTHMPIMLLLCCMIVQVHCTAAWVFAEFFAMHVTVAVVHAASADSNFKVGEVNRQQCTG